MAISTPKRAAVVLANQALRPKLTSRLELIGAHIALSYLETPFPHQRPLRSYHVTYLRHLMKAGHFRQGTEIHVANVSGARYVVNGQHTLSAVIYEQCSVWLSVVEYTCTMEEAHRLYQTFDRNLQRSLTDLYRADPGFEEIKLLDYQTWEKIQVCLEQMDYYAEKIEGAIEDFRGLFEQDLAIADMTKDTPKV